MFIEYPQCFQIRKGCIISYTDPSYFKRKFSSAENEKKEIKHSNTFSSSAKKRMSKILDLWTWTNENTNTKYSFITLTISSKVDNKINHYKLLKEWIEKIETRYKKFNYVWKAELQENGNIHYHLIVDKEMNWKIIRRQWNKTQTIYVDRYQEKMKNKYKNGYYFDKTMVNENNDVVDEETQQKRYKIGYKANWRNPNSTDVKHPENNDEIKGYIVKYINKKEEDKEDTNKNIKRWWGCNEELQTLKYATIYEEKESIELINEMKKHTLKEIKENDKIKCTIIEKFTNSTVKNVEEKQKTINLNILKKNADINSKLIEKEIKLYNKLYD